jgi:NADH-quinone oxidoreductase subunit D
MHEVRTYTLPVGPQHPALIEPENLEVTIDGETIVDVAINVGYLHRGIEQAMQGRNYIQNLYLAERICGICSYHHQLAYSQTIEKLLDVQVPERARYIRTIMAELERLHSHLLWVGIAAYEIGLDTLFMFAWRDREHVMDLLELISGNRVNYAMCTLGGVRRDIPENLTKKILRVLDVIDSRAKYYAKVFLSDPAILARSKGIGILRKKDAQKYCAVGPTARASGIKYDIRACDQYAAYDHVGFKMIIARAGDVQARVVVRVKEIFEATRILRLCIKRLQKTKPELKKKVSNCIPPEEAVGRVEAPRGELIYYARSDGTDKPARIKIRTPTYANLLILKPMLVNQQLADLPIIVASIDPCFSCTDRVTLINAKNGEKKVLSRIDLKKGFK